MCNGKRQKSTSAYYKLFQVIACTLFLPQPSLAFDYKMSKRIYPFPSPPPIVDAGKSFPDPTFGTEISRITDIRRRQPRSRASGISNEYSRFDPINADGSLLILRATNARWFLYNTSTLKPVRKLSMGGDIEPRWHGTNSNVLYYRTGTRFYKYLINKRKSRLIYDFSKDYPKATRASGIHEGDSSSDSRFWAFAISYYDKSEKKNVYIDWVTFDAEKKKIIASYREKTGNSVTPANTISVSPSGKYVVIERRQTSVCRIDWSNCKALPGRHGHGDLALSYEGKDVFVSQDINSDFITMIHLDTGMEQGIMRLKFRCELSPYSYGIHISGNNIKKPGWVLVSTYSRHSAPCLWHDNSLFMLELKPEGRAWRVAHTNSLMGKSKKDYWAEAFATIDRNGLNVIWASNWGVTNKNYVDVYQARLPDTWYHDLAEAQ